MSRHQPPILIEQREETRFPCVGIHLLYSPATDSVMDKLAETLVQASLVDMSLSGLSFDITTPLRPGDQLAVLVHGLDNRPVERLLARICWQIRLGKDFFRIGTQILDGEIISTEESIQPMLHIQRGANFPAGIAIQCPACGTEAMFNLSGIQPISSGLPNCIPLYDCSHCHTTRTITSLLAHQRQKQRR
ncbi:MAG: PilZ domain-containing protein [Gammaproteobacteria bacterium]|nr:PilZ domain-containing protein [Gammaproteobacteria bacterium]MDH5650270.1 PilZ domain-containing protein [Gammaproteobacteria bacterium]